METAEQDSRPPQYPHSGPRYALVAVLAITTCASLFYVYRQRREDRQLETTNQSLSASLTQVQEQLQSVTRRLNDLIVERPSPAIQPSRTRATARPSVQAKAARARTPDDPRFSQIQSQLSAQQKAISSTQEDLGKTRDDLGKTRDDLESTLSSTRDELSGSIARTHDELAELQKRGERNYYEFNLNKSKEFQRVGPVSVSLRKANVKRKSFNLAMLVDDNQLQKKDINLYEPVWINLQDRPQPVELVVNQIDKDQIRGYISEPKYKNSDLKQTSSTAPAASPIR